VWDAIKQHFKDEALKYILGLAVVAAGLFVVKLWTFSENRMEAAVLDRLRNDILEQNKDTNKPETDATLASSIKEFQKSMRTFVSTQVNQINKRLIGWVHSDTFQLDYAHTKKQSFGIFAGNNSHVYLEFNISQFDSDDSDNYDIQLLVYDERVCQGHHWKTGQNIVEFDVSDVINKKLTFLGDCSAHHEGVLADEATRVHPIIGGHDRQFIPARLSITKKPISSDWSDATNMTNGTTDTGRYGGNNSSEKKTNVTIEYVVVVSPLIGDALSTKDTDGRE
jgi:hypothetical protein